MVQDTNANNRLPELYSRVSPATSSIPLQAGSGAYAGRWVSTGVPDSEPTHGDSLLGLALIQALSGLGPAAEVLYNSSGGRWKTPFADLQVGLQLVAATAGLQVGAGGDADIFDQSSTFALGSSQTLQFLPTFHVAQTALAGVYSASFRLVSLGGSRPALDGGVFHLDFSAPAPVPEPQTALLLALGLAGLAWRQRRRNGLASGG